MPITDPIESRLWGGIPFGGANVFEHWPMLSDSSTILSNKVESTPTDSQLHATIP